MKPFVDLRNWLSVSISLAIVPAAFGAVPIINGFSPSAGSAGSSVTISGVNFGVQPTNDIVYFGPVRATVTSANGTNIVVTVPTGAMYAPITVTTGGLVAYSINPFKPTFSGSGAPFDVTSFAPRVDLPMPNGPTRVAVADLNGDGKPDLIVGSIYAHQITILENMSTNGSLDTNSFVVAVTIPFVNTAESPYWVVAGDVDGDGKIDIIAPDEAGNQILVYRNISTGGELTTNSFAAPVAFATGMSPRNIALRDLDGDGRPDLAVANVGDGTVSILKNVGVAGVIDTNSFAAQFVLQAGSMPHDLVVGDLDGDGKPDLAVNNYASPFVSLFRNVSVPGVLDTNSFAAQVTLPSPLFCNSIVLGDMDGDGKQDLLIGTAEGTNELSVYRNIATPGALSTNSFGPELDFPAAGWVTTVAVGDLNGDGKLDVAVVNQMNSTFSVFQNVGSGNFTNMSLASRVDYVSGNNPCGVVIVDLDGDGRPDVIFNNAYSSSTSIYRNLDGTGFGPVITSQPTNRIVAAGSTVTFSVSAIGTVPLSYQWWKSTGKILNATSSTLTLTNVQSTNAGTYFVVVTNLYGSVTSSNAVLTVTNGSDGTAPAITKQPSNQVATVGGNVTFSVTASGTPTLHYLWYFGEGTFLSSSTNSSLTISNVQPGNAGNYFVFVTNQFGFATSSNAVLTVLGATNPPPSCFPPPSGIAAWWRAEDNTIDSINSNNGVVNGGISYTDGEVGHAFRFNGTNTYISVPASPSLNVGTGNGLTIECWIKPDHLGPDGANGRPILEYDTDTQIGVQFWFEAGYTLFANIKDTNGVEHQIQSAPGTIQTNAFQHVAVTYNKTNGNCLLYINGVQAGSANFGSITPQTSYPVYLGLRAANGYPGTGSLYNGLMDEVSLYSRALTPNEIASIYNAGSAGKCFTGTAPTITIQPSNRVAAVGSNVTFSVTATGSPALHYQWYFGQGTFLSSSTNSTLTISNVQPSNAGNYFVIVTNMFGSATSSNAVLTVTNPPTGDAPVITKQPTNQTVVAGANVTFSVTATGSPTLHYQWYFGGGDFISSSTSPSLTISNVQPGNAGNYFVVVSNLFGFTTSSNAVLTVLGATNPPPSCFPVPSGIAAWWPAESNGLDVVGGNTATPQSGVAFAPGEVGQAFFLNGTNAYLTAPASSNLNVAADGSFTAEAWIKVSDVAGYHPIVEWNDNAGHAGAHLWILPYSGETPGVLFANLVDTNGGSHSFHSLGGNVAANVFQHVAVTYDRGSGVATLYVNGNIVAQQNFEQFTPQTSYPFYMGHRPNDNPGEGTFGSYLGGLLDEVSLYRRALSQSEIQGIYNAGTNGKCPGVNGPAPVITSQPTNQTVTVGGTAVFAVTVVGTPPINYQWSGPAGLIPGATNSVLTLSNVQPTNAGSYHVSVNDGHVFLNSSNAILTVTFGVPTIRVINRSGLGGSSIDVPVTLSANGNENALSFSLSFNPTQLVYSAVSLGGGATNALLLPNVSQAGNGRIGIELALPAGTTFNFGTQELVRVTFNTSVVTSTQAVVAAVNFTDQPIAKLLSDALGNSLPVTFSNGTVTLTRTTRLEGDVAPRPSGNGSVDLFDWVQVGRFVAGLDTITNGAEFQKVDCAPRDTLGDGQITVTDWVQAGRYAAGLDPLTLEGGPTGPVSPTFAKAVPKIPTTRQVALGGGTTVKGLTTTLPINLVAQGDETALAFSLSFDPTALRYVGAVKGSAASSAFLNVNATQAASGKLAMVLCLPADGSHFAAGANEIARVSFVALANGANNSVSFADQPVPRGISDANAVELAASYVGNAVVINPEPVVTMSVTGNSSALTWPAWAGDFTLQAADSLTQPIWTNVPVTLHTNGNNIEITLPAGSQQTFFRLYHP